MPFTTLISTSALAKCVDERTAIVIDCRFKLDDPDWGAGTFRTSHIPGAVYAHLDRDLSGRKTGMNGRHPLPDIGTLAATLGRLGVSNGVQVVAYDQDNGIYASRLWWMLRWIGTRRRRRPRRRICRLDLASSRAVEQGERPPNARLVRRGSTSRDDCRRD